MEKFRKRCTCFIIAHRLTTIKHADRILVIEKGKLVEDGSHRELIINKGKHYNLYAGQFRVEREERSLKFEVWMRRGSVSQRPPGIRAGSGREGELIRTEHTINKTNKSEKKSYTNKKG